MRIWSMKLNFLAENKMQNEIEQLFLKCKHRKKIHEHEKQQNDWTT